MNTYQPKAGTLAAKVIAHLSAAGEGATLQSGEIIDLFGGKQNNVGNKLKAANDHGVVRIKILAPGRGGYVYTLGDGTPPPEQPQAVADRPAPLSSMPITHGLTAALYNDGELYLHGVQRMADGGVLLSAPQTAELRAYLLHTGQVSAIASANGGSLT